ncbi:MAG: single-stranded DNA-binding protein [Prevotella sp.]|nr:single-stranded DNA-binding protein [Prevotella sp.]
MNKVMLIGNVGTEPEVRYFEVDSCVARVRLATTEKGYVLQNGTRVPDRTDWHNLVFYRKLAKVVEQYVHKGDKLYVDGRLQYSQYDDKRGVQRMATEIIVDNMEMLTPKSASQPAQPAPSAQPAQQPAQQPQQPANASEPDDSVVPF